MLCKIQESGRRKCYEYFPTENENEIIEIKSSQLLNDNFNMQVKFIKKVESWRPENSKNDTYI